MKCNTPFINDFEQRDNSRTCAGFGHCKISPINSQYLCGLDMQIHCVMNPYLHIRAHRPGSMTKGKKKLHCSFKSHCVHRSIIDVRSLFGIIVSVWWLKNWQLHVTSPSSWGLSPCVKSSNVPERSILLSRATVRHCGCGRESSQTRSYRWL